MERNALRANLARRAQDWRWSSLWLRQHGTRSNGDCWLPGPSRASGRRQQVNEPQTEAELEAIRRSVIRGQPYGSSQWVQRTAKRWGWNPHSGNGAGRPRRKILPLRR